MKLRNISFYKNPLDLDIRPHLPATSPILYYIINRNIIVGHFHKKHKKHEWYLSLEPNVSISPSLVVSLYERLISSLSCYKLP